MQVLENAVKKLKMPSHAEEPSTRIEPRFETSEPSSAEPRMTSMPERAKTSDPIELSIARAATEAAAAPKAAPSRGPLFADLPDPEFDDEAPMTTDTGGSGGGGAGSRSKDEERRFGPWITGLGAVASIALVVGVSVWTFKLGQRDAREVPIVAALEGPARVAPENAGGLQVAHQGHSVNTVLEGRGVEEVASAVTVAPSDNDLTSEDAALAELSALVASRVPESRPTVIVPGSTSISTEGVQKPLMPNGTVVATAPVTNETVDESVGEVAGATVEVVEPQTQVATVDIPLAPGATIARPSAPTEETAAVQPGVESPSEPVVADPVVAETAPTEPAQVTVQPAELEVAALGPLPPLGQGSIYAPAVMKMPQARPADLNVAMSNAVNAALQAVLSESAASPQVEAAPVEVASAASPLDTIPLPNGTRMIQLGAYGSEAVARQQWDRLSSQHDDLLGAKAHYVQRTSNSGKVFYRLRVAGYNSQTDTQAACAALTARGLPCIPVTLR